MIDEIYDRNYQAGRAALNGALTNVLSAGFRHLRAEIRNTSEALNRIEFSAPWAARAKGRSD